MTRKVVASAAVAALFFSTMAIAATQGEFDNECVMGLALGKDIKTDCSVNTEYKGKTYCFGNEQAKDLFLKNPDEFVLKAQVYHSSRAQAPAATPDASKAP
jgi:YHS domain-containing protein